MEKAIFPMKCINISQGYNEGTHLDSYAVDNVGCVSEIEDVYMPFTGTIKKIYKEDANEVWIESNDKVLYADGTIDYMTVMTMHDNDVSNLKVGDIIKMMETNASYEVLGISIDTPNEKKVNDLIDLNINIKSKEINIFNSIGYFFYRKCSTCIV